MFVFYSSRRGARKLACLYLSSGFHLSLRAVDACKQNWDCTNPVGEMLLDSKHIVFGLMVGPVGAALTVQKVPRNGADD